MKLLIFSDIHNDLGALEKLMATEADYYFAAGDLATWSQGLDRAAKVMQARADRLYVLPGNHETAAQIEDMCARHGFHYFHETAMRLGEYEVAGFGYSSPTPFNTPGEYSEQEIARRLEAFAGLKPLVLICHCPPYGSPLDRVREGVHAGSTAIRDFLAREQPAYFFSGHIHEAAGVTAQLGRTFAASLGRRGYLLELK